MKYTTVEDVMASFPHPVLPTVQVEPDYQTIHVTRKFLQANSRATDTHLGGGALGHLDLIISDASYAMIPPTTDSGPKLEKPICPRAFPNQHGWNSGPNQRCMPHLGGGRSHLPDMHLRATGFEKQIICVFEPMYLDILNDTMFGLANISARDHMLDHLFETYGNITAVDLEINFDHMRRAWDPQQPVESLLSRFKIVQIILKQEASSLDTRNKSMLVTPKYLQLVTS
jgi:hypothetical protein